MLSKENTGFIKEHSECSAAWTSEILAQKGNPPPKKKTHTHTTYILKETQEGSHYSVAYYQDLSDS